MSRIRTNGVFDPTRPSNDHAHAQAWLRHRQLRSLVKSPARDTAECAAVVALAERHGLSLAAVPDLYNALWEVRNLERQMQESQSPAQAGGLESIKLLELEDFMNRFRRDFAVDPNPVFGELVGLGLHPSVFFGVPDVSARPGEPLLTD